MATLRWTGQALAVKQVVTGTVGGTVEVGDEFKATIGNKVMTHVATSTSTSTTASEFATQWNNLDPTLYPEFAEITASAASSVVSLTADTAGKEFTVTLTTTESGGGAADAQTFVQATATANAGPNDWSSAGNWSTNTAPVDADDVYIENSALDILYGLSQSSIDLTSLNIAASYTGKIGLPKHNGTYAEYRTDYLTLGTATTLRVGYGPGPGSPRIKLNVGSNACTFTCWGTATSAEVSSGVPTLLWKGTSASNAVNIYKGSVGLGFYGGESFTIATLQSGYTTTQATDASVTCGDGGTLTTVNVLGGSVEVRDNFTTGTVRGGFLSIKDAATVTTLNIEGGTVYDDSSGTKTTVTVREGTLDCHREMKARTYTNSTFHPGCTVLDPDKRITFTNAFSAPGGMESFTHDFGPNSSWQRS